MSIKNKYKIVTDPLYEYLRIDPIPTQDEVEKYYLEEFYSSGYEQFNDSSLQIQKEEQDFFDSRWQSICDKIIDYFGRIEGLSIFDIGFGFGQALLYFHKKGMVVGGLEPSPEGVEHVKSHGLDVFQAGIEDFSCVGSKRFDAVTLLNVLEHLRNPAETLIDIRDNLLKPNGLLVIDVPNEFNVFQTTANAEFDLGEWWVCPPNHINYFSASSLKHLLDKCGYSVKYCESSFPLEIFMLMGDVYVGNNELGKQCHQKRVEFESLMRKHGNSDFLSKFYQLLADVDVGRQVIVYATPKKGGN